MMTSSGITELLFCIILSVTAHFGLGANWEFGEDKPESVVVAHSQGEITLFQKTKYVQFHVPSCKIVVYVRVDVENKINPPTVSYNKHSNTVIISYGLLQSSWSTYNVVAKGVPDPHCVKDRGYYDYKGDNDNNQSGMKYLNYGNKNDIVFDKNIKVKSINGILRGKNANGIGSVTGYGFDKGSRYIQIRGRDRGGDIGFGQGRSSGYIQGGGNRYSPNRGNVYGQSGGRGYGHGSSSRYSHGWRNNQVGYNEFGNRNNNGRYVERLYNKIGDDFISSYNYQNAGNVDSRGQYDGGAYDLGVVANNHKHDGFDASSECSLG